MIATLRLPFVAVLVALAVGGTLVGATVLLSSNVANNSNNVTISTDNHGFLVNLGKPSVKTLSAAYAGDTSGVTYPITGTVPESLTTVTATITIANITTSSCAVKTPMSWSNIGPVWIELNGVWMQAAQSTYTHDSLTFTASFSSLSQGALVGSLNAVYNIPGTFEASVTLSGTAV
jgi:hypothetical protein